VIERTANAAPQSLSSKSNCRTDARRFELVFREFYAAPGRLHILNSRIREVATPAPGNVVCTAECASAAKASCAANRIRTRRRKKKIYDSNLQDFPCHLGWQDENANYLKTPP
jgi:hypothetical protein